MTAQHFRQRLLRWFDESARDLPWRRTKDPYRIWLSEIMLQQTRVAAVLEHYAEFLNRFPTLPSLAAASEAEVLAAWSGLGYYRRARMLHKATQRLIAEHGAVIPTTAEELRKLPGIGEYTSAAIASIAFGEAVAVVDGNVERVVMRLRGLSGQGEGQGVQSKLAAAIRSLASALLDADRPGDFNQAMMELGATVCLPRNPLCLGCPVQSLCATRGEHPTRARQPARIRDAAYALVQRRRDDHIIEVLLEQRPNAVTVMKGMWELPEIDAARLSSPLLPEFASLKLRHAIMQTNYRVRVCSMTRRQALELRAGHGDLHWFSTDDLHRLPLTGLARKVLKRVGLLATAASAGSERAQPIQPRTRTELSQTAEGSESPFKSFPV